MASLSSFVILTQYNFLFTKKKYAIEHFKLTKLVTDEKFQDRQK